MKRSIYIALTALLLVALVWPAAYASDEAALRNEMTLTVNGESFHLTFDPSPSYTSLANGYLQASYFAELDDALYELYMIFPAGVHTGDVISAERCVEGGDEKSGFLLFITTNDGDITSLATQDVVGQFPAGSGYAITFDQVDDTKDDTSYAGTLTGTLVDVDPAYNASGETHAIQGSFHFSTGLTKAAAEEAEPSGRHLTVPEGAKKI